MFTKPNEKPSVLDWLNPLANGWLTIRQDKTRQDKTRWVLVPRTKTKTHRTCLLVNLSSKVFFLGSSFCERIQSAQTRPLEAQFSTGFQQVFNNSQKEGFLPWFTTKTKSRRRRVRYAVITALSIGAALNRSSSSAIRTSPFKGQSVIASTLPAGNAERSGESIRSALFRSMR